jgi:hypothetical protein
LYDDGGYSGGTLDRPALQRLLADIADAKVNVVVVYKIDRLTRSLFDFAKIVEAFDARGVSFVSITQQFNTTTSMGRLTLTSRVPNTAAERGDYANTPAITPDCRGLPQCLGIIITMTTIITTITTVITAGGIMVTAGVMGR